MKSGNYPQFGRSDSVSNWKKWSDAGASVDTTPPPLGGAGGLLPPLNLGEKKLPPLDFPLGFLLKMTVFE